MTEIQGQILSPPANHLCPLSPQLMREVSRRFLKRETPNAEPRRCLHIITPRGDKSKECSVLSFIQTYIRVYLEIPAVWIEFCTYTLLLTV